MGIIGFSLFVLGIILIISSAVGKKKNKRCSAQTQGTLVNIYEAEDSNGNDVHSYTYSYNVDGVEYEVRSQALTEANKIGDTLTIWYNPKKPKDAQPFHYESMKIYKIFLLVGIALLLLGIILSVLAI